MQEAEQFGLLAIGPFGTVGSFPDNDSSIEFKIASNFGYPNELSETTPSCPSGVEIVIRPAGKGSSINGKRELRNMLLPRYIGPQSNN